MTADKQKNRYEALREDFERIKGAPGADRKALLRELARDLKRRDPNTAANIAFWTRNGVFLLTAIASALKSANARDEIVSLTVV